MKIEKIDEKRYVSVLNNVIYVKAIRTYRITLAGKYVFNKEIAVETTIDLSKKTSHSKAWYSIPKTLNALFTNKVRSLRKKLTKIEELLKYLDSRLYNVENVVIDGMDKIEERSDGGKQE